LMVTCGHPARSTNVCVPLEAASATIRLNQFDRFRTVRNGHLSSIEGVSVPIEVRDRSDGGCPVGCLLHSMGTETSMTTAELFRPVLMLAFSLSGVALIGDIHPCFASG